MKSCRAVPLGRQGPSLYYRVEMYLAKDYVHHHQSDAGIGSRCRIRLYLPYEGTDAAVVVCSDIPDAPGPSARALPSSSPPR